MQKLGVGVVGVGRLGQAPRAGGLGVKMADPSREVYVLVGDGWYL